MKKALLLFIVCFCALNLFAQNKKKNFIGAYVASGGGDYRYRNQPGYRATYITQMKSFIGGGIDYSRTLLKRVDICTGFEYTYNQFMRKNDPTHPNVDHLQFVTIPVQLKCRFGNYFFLKGGGFFHLSGKVGDSFRIIDGGIWQKLPHTGIKWGYGVGIGFEHEFNSGMTFMLHPYIRWNGTGKKTDFNSEPIEAYTLLQAGISFGVGYKF